MRNAAAGCAPCEDAPGKSYGLPEPLREDATLLSRKNKVKPGILLYFDQAEAFEYFTDAEVGQIVRAALRFGQFGEDTVFQDRAQQAAWHSIRLALIRDHASYFRDIAERTYSSMCRVWKEAGAEYPEKDAWIESETQRLLSLDAERSRTVPSAPNRKDSQQDTQPQHDNSVITSPAPARYAPTACESAPDNRDGESLSIEQEFEEKRRKAIESLNFRTSKGF